MGLIFWECIVGLIMGNVLWVWYWGNALHFSTDCLFMLWRVWYRQDLILEEFIVLCWLLAPLSITVITSCKSALSRWAIPWGVAVVWLPVIIQRRTRSMSSPIHPHPCQYSHFFLKLPIKTLFSSEFAVSSRLQCVYKIHPFQVCACSCMCLQACACMCVQACACMYVWVRDR